MQSSALEKCWPTRTQKFRIDVKTAGRTPRLAAWLGNYRGVGLARRLEETRAEALAGEGGVGGVAGVSHARASVAVQIQAW